MSAIFWAAYKVTLDVLMKIWVWAENNLTTEELNRKFLLATDNDVWTAWHLTAHQGYLGILLRNVGGLNVTNNRERK
jgi:hypothetical protein